MHTETADLFVMGRRFLYVIYSQYLLSFHSELKYSS